MDDSPYRSMAAPPPPPPPLRKHVQRARSGMVRHPILGGLVLGVIGMLVFPVTLLVILGLAWFRYRPVGWNEPLGSPQPPDEDTLPDHLMRRLPAHALPTSPVERAPGSDEEGDAPERATRAAK